ncbi:MAG: hypothetical protein JKY66_07115 [Spongiibacteraceae bacterium]|nr:hypothetical protein [Spongiibacteraceae bacterium]
MVASINSFGLSPGFLKGVNEGQEKEKSALEKISSGNQLNSAADNAAGIAIIERFASQISGFGQAIRNASDATSITQTAEAILSTAGEDIQKIRELSVASANASLSDNDRANLQSQVEQLQDQVRTSFDQANVNGVDFFKSESTQSFQVGANADETIDISTRDLSSDIAVISRLDISTQSGAQSALSAIDNVLQTFNDQQVDLGVLSNRLDSSISNLQNNKVNTQEASSRIKDTDVAKEVSQQINGQIQQQSGIAVQSQANSNARLVLQLLS